MKPTKSCHECGTTSVHYITSLRSLAKKYSDFVPEPA